MQGLTLQEITTPDSFSTNSALAAFWQEAQEVAEQRFFTFMEVVLAKTGEASRYLTNVPKTKDRVLERK